MSGPETPLTQLPVNAPDILMNRPLDRQVDVTIETNVLEPVSHSYVSSNGGRTRWVLPKRGVLDASECAISFQLLDVEGTNGQNNLCFPLHSGALACVNRCTLRSGTQILSQVVNAGQYGTMKANFNTSGYKEGVLDAYHLSSNVTRNRVLPAKLAAGVAAPSFHQVYNVEADQTSEFGRLYSTVSNTHVAQPSKCLKQTAGQGPEIVIRLGDIFPIFSSGFKLPLLGMAQVELEIEWTRGGIAGQTGTDITDCNVTTGGADSANTYENADKTCETTMTTPYIIMDLHHYDDMETQKIRDAIASPAGMSIDFTEVVVTKGVNPAIAAVANTVSAVQSTHLLGMSMKEVQCIYVQKNYSLNSTRGIVERDHLYPDAASVQMALHRNPMLRQYKSQQIFGEEYNFVINNNRLYPAPVANKATQYNYLNQTYYRPYNCAPGEFDTTNYNQNATQVLMSAGCATGEGFSHKYLPGSSNYFGLSLEKNVYSGSESRAVRGNGMRIGSTPIEFQYQCLKMGNRTAPDPVTVSQAADVDLTFYIDYRRSMIINSLGVVVSDA